MRPLAVTLLVVMALGGGCSSPSRIRAEDSDRACSFMDSFLKKDILPWCERRRMAREWKRYCTHRELPLCRRAVDELTELARGQQGRVRVLLEQERDRLASMCREWR